MASATDSDVNVELLGADYSGLNMGFGGRREDEFGFWSGREYVTEVLSGGIEDGGEGRVALGVNGGEEREVFV